MQARKADQRPAVIQMKFGKTYVEVVEQRQKVTVEVHLDPGHSDKLWIGGKGNGTTFFVGSSQTRDVDC